MKKILIAGAGNIGFWYFVALNKIKYFKFKIYVYDKKKKSLYKFEKKTKGNKNIYYFSNLCQLPKKIDLAIISSTAKDRSLLIEKIFFISKAKNFIVEKIVEQNQDKLDKILSLSKKTKIFISLPFRCSNFFKNISKKRITNYNFDILSKSLDLACNSFHFLDLSSWILKKRVKKIDISKHKSWHNSKREGFIDVCGSIKFIFGRNSILKFTADADNTINKKGFTHLRINNKFYSIEDWYTHIKNSESIIKSNNLSISNVMNMEIPKILKNKRTNLPRFETIYYNHSKYIESLLLHYNKNKKIKKKLLPIT